MPDLGIGPIDPGGIGGKAFGALGRALGFSGRAHFEPIDDLDGQPGTLEAASDGTVTACNATAAGVPSPGQ